jgi:hypothetical protein
LKTIDEREPFLKHVSGDASSNLNPDRGHGFCRSHGLVKSKVASGVTEKLSEVCDKDSSCGRKELRTSQKNSGFGTRNSESTRKVSGFGEQDSNWRQTYDSDRRTQDPVKGTQDSSGKSQDAMSGIQDLT